MSDQERLARALGRDPESMHDDEQVRENQWVCKRCGRAIVAVPSYTWRRADYGPCTPEPLDIDWSIVPTVLADIEKRGWILHMSYVTKWAVTIANTAVATDFPTALVLAYVEAVEGKE